MEEKDNLNFKEQILPLQYFLSPAPYGDGGLTSKIATNLGVLLISKKNMEVWLWSYSITGEQDELKQVK